MVPDNHIVPVAECVDVAGLATVAHSDPVGSRCISPTELAATELPCFPPLPYFV